MGLRKDIHYPLEDFQLSELARALAHPARIAIFRLLIEKNTCLCGEIVDEIPLAQSTISQHLKAMKEAGIIMGEIEGAKTCYCIDNEHVNKLSNSLFALLGSNNRIAKAPNSCGCHQNNNLTKTI